MSNVVFNWNAWGGSPWVVAAGVNAALANNAFTTVLPPQDVFSALGRRLTEARSEAMAQGRPVETAELVLSEDEWAELSVALKLEMKGSEPVFMWGIPVRVEWKPGTMAARRRVDKEEVLRELGGIMAELQGDE